MDLNVISFSILLILMFASIFHSNDSQFIQNENLNSFDFKHLTNNIFETLESEQNNHFEGRTGSNALGPIDSIFGRFWHSLYMNRGFNSSFVLLLPLFTITIPGYGRGIQSQTPLSALNIGNLAIFGILVFGTLALWAPIIYPDFSWANEGKRSFNWEEFTENPAKRLILLTEQIIGKVLEVDDKETKVNNFLLSRLHSVVEFVMKYLDRILDEIPEYPGLHPQQCIKRCICESYKKSDKNGRISQIIRFIFRPYRESTKNVKKLSKYRLAANYGLKDKSIDCENRFKGCELNFLHLMHNLIQFLF